VRLGLSSDEGLNAAPFSHLKTSGFTMKSSLKKQRRRRHLAIEDRSNQVAQCYKSWLGWQDSNLRMAASKAAALPLGDTPIFAGLILAGRAGERAYYPVCPQGARGSYI
tara:strand:+ start:2003 stop:2329 length:327 start_codon:yes stop_codon:yes gene_type:complete